MCSGPLCFGEHITLIGDWVCSKWIKPTPSPYVLTFTGEKFTSRDEMHATYLILNVIGVV